MRHTIIAAAVLGAAVLSAGCSTSDERAEAGGSSTSSSAATSSATAVPTVVDLEFLNALDKVPIMYSKESDIIAIGHKVCDARQAGGSQSEVIAAVMGAHYGYSVAESIVDYAEKYYCPHFWS